ncbi:RBM7 protein, partial [Nyctibius bracteatus]|nr:RBM7 protein [Nyctibius bracteatus]
QAGPVVKVKIPKDREGRPKQFAFVNFKHEESVPYGLSLLNGIKLFGRPIKIQFRAGSTHASQDSNPACPPHGPASTGLPGAPHPASHGSRYPPALCREASAPHPPPLSLFSLQMHSAGRQQPPFGGKYEQPGFPLPAYQHAPLAFHPSKPSQMPRRPEGPAPRKARLSAHPYQAESRHFGREPRFGERGHDAEQHYRGGREEPAYEDRHRDGWSHDYDYRRESYREAKWHPSRH